MFFCNVSPIPNRIIIFSLLVKREYLNSETRNKTVTIIIILNFYPLILIQDLPKTKETVSVNILVTIVADTYLELQGRVQELTCLIVIEGILLFLNLFHNLEIWISLKIYCLQFTTCYNFNKLVFFTTKIQHSQTKRE